MPKSASYFICGNRAYRSEIALFRQERITAERCARVKARPGLSQLHLVEGSRGGLSVWDDAQKALQAMVRRRGRGLVSIAVR